MSLCDLWTARRPRTATCWMERITNNFSIIIIIIIIMHIRKHLYHRANYDAMTACEQLKVGKQSFRTEWGTILVK